MIELRNYNTKETDYLEEWPTTEEGLLPYVPDWELDASGGPTRALFQLRILRGDEPLDAFATALRAHLGLDTVPESTLEKTS